MMEHRVDAARRLLAASEYLEFAIDRANGHLLRDPHGARAAVNWAAGRIRALVPDHAPVDDPLARYIRGAELAARSLTVGGSIRAIVRAIDSACRVSLELRQAAERYAETAETLAAAAGDVPAAEVEWGARE